MTAIAVGYLAFSCLALSVDRVPSESMEPTIPDGSFVLSFPARYGLSTANLPLGSAPETGGRFPASLTPKRGDVVLFRLNSFQGRKIIKRVIGLPGDHVEVVGRRLRVNGIWSKLEQDGSFPCNHADGAPLCEQDIESVPGLLPQHRVAFTAPGRHLDTDMVVPAGRLFVMGDNRDLSMDSRFGDSLGGTGLVPLSRLIGALATSIP